MARLKCYGSSACFDSCLQLISIVGFGVSHLSLHNTPHRFCMGIRSGQLTGQSGTVTPWSVNQLLVVLSLWTGTKPASP